ncbi:MAG: HAD-IA family hydrolase [Anaerolineae bacterium]|nr:HAD-IA family hydrolase [Anaerolineae bacterium]
MDRSRGEIRAVFFDRDETLCYHSQERDQEFFDWVQSRSRYQDVPFSEARERVGLEFFDSHRADLIVDVGTEAWFWVEYWRRSLELLGIDDSHLDEALEKFVFFKFSQLYPETQEVLTTLYDQGFLLGVISDTFPSLSDSLSYLRLDRLFHVVIDSTSAGAMKPSPLIYQKALEELSVSAQESLFVDDVPENVDGARAVGMQALWLDRLHFQHDLRAGVIANLRGVLRYLAK